MSFRQLAVLSLPAAAMAYNPRGWLAARQVADNCTTTVTLPLVTSYTSLPPTTYTPGSGTGGATGTGGGTASVTKTMTEDCEETGVVTHTAPVSTITAAPSHTSWVTEYTTVYETVCETGVDTVTYTITKTCTDVCHHDDPTALPPGFTTTVTVCTACGPHDVTTTLTVPCETGAPTHPVVDPPVVTPAPEHEYYTTYVTEYPAVCETGIETLTYTVTQHCEDEHKCHRPTDSPPDGFTKTVVECTACGEVPVTTTITVPVVPWVPAPTDGGAPPAPPAGEAPAPGAPAPGAPAPGAPAPPAGQAPGAPPSAPAAGAPAPPAADAPPAAGAPAPPAADAPPAAGAPAPPSGEKAPKPEWTGIPQHGGPGHRNGTSSGTAPASTKSAATSKHDATATSPTEVPTEPATAGVSGRSVEVLVGVVSVVFAMWNLAI